MVNAGQTIFETALDPASLVRENSSFPYYAVQVRCRYERVAQRWLELRGLGTFLPIYEARRQWSDRAVDIQRPLFPGYVFCSFDATRRLPVLSAPGVVGIVAAGKRPLPVDARELQAVRALASAGRDVQPCAPVPGEKVRIAAGPLKGIEGALLQLRGKNRLVVSISILNRSISAIVDGSDAVLV